MTLGTTSSSGLLADVPLISTVGIDDPHVVIGISNWSRCVFFFFFLIYLVQLRCAHRKLALDDQDLKPLWMNKQVERQSGGFAKAKEPPIACHAFEAMLNPLT